MDLKKQLGLRIKELRMKNKLTQEKLAELVDINTKHQSSIETGRHFPSSELIEKYAKVFSVSPATVLRLDLNEDKNTMIKNITQILSKQPVQEIKKVYLLLCG